MRETSQVAVVVVAWLTTFSVTSSLTIYSVKPLTTSPADAPIIEAGLLSPSCCGTNTVTGSAALPDVTEIVR